MIGKYELHYVANEHERLLIDHAQSCLKNLGHPAFGEMIEHFESQSLPSTGERTLLLITTTTSSVSLDIKMVLVGPSEATWEHLPSSAAMAAVFSDAAEISVASEMLNFGEVQGASDTLGAARSRFQNLPIALDYSPFNQSCYFLSVADSEGSFHVIQLSESKEQDLVLEQDRTDRSVISNRDLISEILAMTERGWRE